MKGVLAQLQKFGLGRLAMMAGVLAGVAGVLAAVMLRVGGEPKALLYANLDMKEAASITETLEQQGVAYELKGDGSTILVPRDQVAATRLALSAEGLPTSGSVGYEIFDESNALGQTDFVQQLNRQRALEGELARTIRSLKGLSSARVHLVLPKRQLFEDEAEQPSATVVVGLAGGRLTGQNIQALRNLVAGAVPGLKPDRVTLIDENNELLASGTEGGDGANAAVADGRRAELEARLTTQLREMVEGVVGAGKAKIKVAAELDLARVTVQQETFDPDGQVVRSTTTAEETGREQARDPSGEVSASENIPGSDDEGADPTSSSESGRTEETTNYEISKTNRTEIVEPGTVKRLSVAVAVDGVTAPGEGGKPGAYTPRSAEEMQRIEQLVRSAVGYDQRRGDQVSVINVQFNRTADGVGGTEAASPLAGFDKNDIMRAAELLVLTLTGALLILFVVRPLMRGASGGYAAAGGAGALAIAGVGPGAAAAAQLGHDGAGQLAIAGPQGELDQRIEMARVEGQVKASSVKKVADFVDKHPEESVSILRGWLNEG